MELFKHQQEALEQTKDLNRVAYYLDENGEWVSSCPGCPYNTLEGDYEDE